MSLFDFARNVEIFFEVVIQIDNIVRARKI